MKDKKTIEEFFKLLNEGEIPSRACKKLGLNPKSMNYYYHKYNIFPKNKFSKYNMLVDYFDEIDNANKAYFLGLIIADGCIIIENKFSKLTNNPTNSYRISIGLQEEDGYILSKFSKELGFEKKMAFSNNQNGVKIRKKQRRFRFNSKYMVKKLIEKYKILPNKTKDLNFKFPFETIPEEFQKDFIRGYFDGDGSVSFYKYKNTIFFNFSFVFTSLIFTNQIAEIFKKRFNIIPVIRFIKGKTVNHYTLRFNYSRNRTNKIKEIYNWLYTDAESFLHRKNTKFKEYFKYRDN